MQQNKLRHSLLKYTSNSTSIFLALVVLLAVCLRLYQLDSLPFGALIDEASYGYSAYSILQTGKDELGNQLPMHFKAFGDEKLPLYAYTLVPVIKVFGLSNFSVRLPSAIAGVALVLVAFALIKELYKNSSTALFAALVVAVSPWTLMLSRIAFESNIALMLFAISILLFIKSYKYNKARLFFLSGFILSLTWYAYIPYRPISTGVAIVLAILHFTKFGNIKSALLYLTVFFVFVLPILPHTLFGRGTTRFSQVGFLSNPSTTLEVNEHRSYCSSFLPPSLCKVFYNKPVLWSRDILSNQLQSLGTDFLFVGGENALIYLSIFNYGTLLSIMAPFYFLGLAHILAKSIDLKYKIAFIAVLFITTLPSALVGDPQRVRLSASFLCILLLLSQGFDLINHSPLATRLQRNVLMVAIYICTIYFGLVFASSTLLVHFNKFSLDYSGPTRAAIEYASRAHPKNDIIFSNNMHDAILHYAYYTKLDPAKYQAFAKYKPVDSGGFSHPISYKDVFMESQPISSLYCKYIKEKKSFYYISLERSPDIESLGFFPEYKYPSFDGQSYMSFVYHFNPTDTSLIKCK